MSPSADGNERYLKLARLAFLTALIVGFLIAVTSNRPQILVVILVTLAVWSLTYLYLRGYWKKTSSNSSGYSGTRQNAEPKAPLQDLAQKSPLLNQQYPYQSAAFTPAEFGKGIKIPRKEIERNLLLSTVGTGMTHNMSLISAGNETQTRTPSNVAMTNWIMGLPSGLPFDVKWNKAIPKEDKQYIQAGGLDAGNQGYGGAPSYEGYRYPINPLELLQGPDDLDASVAHPY